MLIQVPVYSFRPFSFQRLSALLGVDDLVLVSSPNETPDAWFFYRRKHAVTMFMIEKQKMLTCCRWIGSPRMTTIAFCHISLTP